MKRISTVAAGACAIAIALGASPAYAQYANEFQIAKVIKQGKIMHAIAGPGTVTVQVQVNADGSHKAMKVLRSTNPGDNAAAMDIAQTSTYRPARRGVHPITSFYDFVLKFNGKSVAPNQETAGGGPEAGKIDALIRSKQYAQAISSANMALLESPGNQALLQLLGTAQYFSGHLASAAATFSRVDQPNNEFHLLAAQALAAGAVKVSSQDPASSLAYAQKAVALENNANSQFALGVAEIANKNYADALTTLKAVRVTAKDTKTKMAIDRELLTAYLGSGDKSSADATASEMKQLDPTSDAAGVAMVNYYLNLGNQAMQAKNFTEALKDFDAAANQGVPAATVTANVNAAFAAMGGGSPNYSEGRDYAMKAVVAKPDSPEANFAAGVAWTGIYSNSRNAKDKQQALLYLKKADGLAKTAGNTGLSLQIENQLKILSQGN